MIETTAAALAKYDLGNLCADVNIFLYVNSKWQQRDPVVYNQFYQQ